MRNIHILAILCCGAVLFSCTKNAETEKHQTKRDNVINVKDDIVEIIKDNVLISSSSRLHLINDYLIVKDMQSTDMLLHLFDRTNYQYIASCVPRGQGPGEITLTGHIAVNEDKKEFYMTDNGKLKIFTYPIDSILNNPYYIPKVKREMNNIQFPNEYFFINDTMCLAKMIEPTGNVGHNEVTAKWNMLTGEAEKMNYAHPKVNKKRISLAVSIDNETLVECYHNHDLMTIMDLDGNLKCNVYGRNWNDGNIVQIYHFGNVFIRKNRIIVSYSGKKMNESRLPNKLLVFNINGNYIKTLDIGYNIMNLCYDEQNDRLLFSFDDMIQFGYLALNDSMFD